VTQRTLPDRLAEELAPHGLRLRGGFRVDAALDAALQRQVPGGRTLLLVGNTGSEMWRRSGAAILDLGAPDPLDRWTRAVVAPIARAHDGTALFPFDGPPYWPFQRWAERAEGVRGSPLGIQIHPEFGLWHAYRAAILLPVELDLPEPRRRNHPCDTCADRPCLAACPVGAFTGAGYEVDHCVNHVVSTKSLDKGCHQCGCLARLACPIGQQWRYDRDHAAFHMEAFVAARLADRYGKLT
jgi:hypothetical protein